MEEECGSVSSSPEVLSSKVDPLRDVVDVSEYKLDEDFPIPPESLSEDMSQVMSSLGLPSGFGQKHGRQVSF